jgi:hypothetical protein
MGQVSPQRWPCVTYSPNLTAPGASFDARVPSASQACRHGRRLAEADVTLF